MDKIKEGTIVRILNDENYNKLAVVTAVDKWDVLGTEVYAYTVVGYKSGSLDYTLQWDGVAVKNVLYLTNQIEKY